MENYQGSNKYELVHCDTCLSDYWSGHHLAHMQIPVDGSTTFKDVRDMLHSELNQGAIGGSVDFEVLESEHFYKKTKAAINRLKSVNKHAKLAFPDLARYDENNGDCCTVYAFFVVVAL